MSSALGELGEFSVDLLKSNHFCTGVKRGKEYVCGGEADENAKGKAVELLDEAIRRMLHWRVWDEWWIEEAMDEWLEKRDRLEIQLRGKYSEEVINDLLGLIDKFINYNERLWNYWHEASNDVRKLINDLLNSKAEVIIWSNEKGVSVHYEYITLNVHKTNTGIIVQLVLKELKGITVEAPDVFRKTMSREEYAKFINKVLKALRGGLEETDGFIKDGKAGITTTQVWQAIVWALLYPGKTYIRIISINVNEGDVTINWHLRSSHDPLKGKILNDAEKLSEEELLAFTLTAVLGDGSADIRKNVINHPYDEAVIKIAISSKKFDTWKSILSKLWDAGFKWNPNTNEIRFYGSYAIDLTRAMISVLPPILCGVLDALDFEKWDNLRKIAEMEVKWRRGEMQVDVAGYKFTVEVFKGTFELVRPVRNEVEAEKVIDVLKAVYGNELYVRINKYGKYLAIKISATFIEKHDDIKEQVIEVLCRKLKRTKDERKKQIIAKHLMRLTILTKDGNCGWFQPGTSKS